jgi:hypothetical protein
MIAKKNLICFEFLIRFPLYINNNTVAVVVVVVVEVVSNYREDFLQFPNYIVQTQIDRVKGLALRVCFIKEICDII